MLYRLRSRKSFEGQRLGTYFLLAGLVRFGVEFFRGDPHGPALLAGLPSTRVIALAMTGLGGCLLFSRFILRD